MTIALGVQCSDGILLAADSQYSLGDLKSSGPKIFIGGSRKSFNYAIAGSGDVPLIKIAFEKIESRLTDDTTWEKMKEVVGNTVIEIYKKHIAPSNAKFSEYSLLTRYIDLYLIIAVRMEDGKLGLITTDKTAVFSLGQPACVGIGSVLSGLFLNSLFTGTFSVDDAKYLAIYAIQLAKNHVEHCGKTTNILILRKNGAVEIVDRRETERVEGFLDRFNAYQRTTLMMLNPDRDDSDLNQYVKSIKDGFKEFIREQRKNPIPRHILFGAKTKS